MIELSQLRKATPSYAIDLTETEVRLIAGDIENWLLSNKSIICKVEIKR